MEEDVGLVKGKPQAQHREPALDLAGWAEAPVRRAPCSEPPDGPGGRRAAAPVSLEDEGREVGGRDTRAGGPGRVRGVLAPLLDFGGAPR